MKNAHRAGPLGVPHPCGTPVMLPSRHLLRKIMTSCQWRSGQNSDAVRVSFITKTSLAVFLVGMLWGCGGNKAAFTPSVVSDEQYSPSISKAELVPANYIKHVVIIVQENRSFENLFAGWPGADAPLYGKIHTGAQIPLHQ